MTDIAPENLPLIHQLEGLKPFDEAEARHIADTLAFLRSQTNCFDRSNLVGHIVGSAWVLSPDEQSVLLTHHAFLDKWIHLGGHADGEPNQLHVAIREAIEESGVNPITAISEDIFDVDVQPIRPTRAAASRNISITISVIWSGQPTPISSSRQNPRT